MPQLHDLEIFVTMNEGGEYAVATADDDALNTCIENHGGEAFRTVRLMVTMAAPEITAVAVRVPDDAGDTAPGVAAE
jgi:hypothetical protein